MQNPSNWLGSITNGLQNKANPQVSITFKLTNTPCFDFGTNAFFVDVFLNQQNKVLKTLTAVYCASTKSFIAYPCKLLYSLNGTFSVHDAEDDVALYYYFIKNSLNFLLQQLLASILGFSLALNFPFMLFNSEDEFEEFKQNLNSSSKSVKAKYLKYLDNLNPELLSSNLNFANFLAKSYCPQFNKNFVNNLKLLS